MSAGNLITMTPRDERDWPNELRENTAVIAVAKTLYAAQRYALHLPWKDWDTLPHDDRRAFMDAATRALRGVSHEKRQLAEMVGAQTCCASKDVEWFSLSASQQMDFLYQARDVIRGYENCLRGVSHPMEVARARRGRQALKDKWAEQDREVKGALPEVQDAITKAMGEGQ